MRLSAECVQSSRGRAHKPPGRPYLCRPGVGAVAPRASCQLATKCSWPLQPVLQPRQLLQLAEGGIEGVQQVCSRVKNALQAAFHLFHLEGLPCSMCAAQRDQDRSFKCMPARSSTNEVFVWPWLQADSEDGCCHAHPIPDTSGHSFLVIESWNVKHLALGIV